MTMRMADVRKNNDNITMPLNIDQALDARDAISKVALIQLWSLSPNKLTISTFDPTLLKTNVNFRYQQVKNPKKQRHFC